jgi:aspartate oxidase
LLDGAGERFMGRYDERGERATRDIVSRAIDTEMRAGRTTPNGGVYLSMGHLGPGERPPAVQRAWSSAAPTAASTSPAAESKSCRRRTT